MAVLATSSCSKAPSDAAIQTDYSAVERLQAKNVWEQVVAFDRHIQVKANWLYDANATPPAIVPNVEIVSLGGWDDLLVDYVKPGEQLPSWPRLDADVFASNFSIALMQASAQFLNERNVAALSFSPNLEWSLLSDEPEDLEKNFSSLLNAMTNKQCSFEISIGKGNSSTPYSSTTTGGDGLWRISGFFSMGSAPVRTYEILEFGNEFQSTLNSALTNALRSLDSVD